MVRNVATTCIHIYRRTSMHDAGRGNSVFSRDDGKCENRSCGSYGDASKPTWVSGRKVRSLLSRSEYNCDVKVNSPSEFLTVKWISAVENRVTIESLEFVWFFTLMECILRSSRVNIFTRDFIREWIWCIPLSEEHIHSNRLSIRSYGLGIHFNREWTIYSCDFERHYFHCHLEWKRRHFSL